MRLSTRAGGIGVVRGEQLVMEKEERKSKGPNKLGSSDFILNVLEIH